MEGNEGLHDDEEEEEDEEEEDRGNGLVGFMFGNVDKDMQLEDDYMDEVLGVIANRGFGQVPVDLPHCETV